MLAWLMGELNAYSAAAAVALSAGLTIVVTSMVVKRRSRREMEMEHELAMFNAQKSHERDLFTRDTDRQYKIGQLRENLITSHARDMGDTDQSDRSGHG